MEGAIAGSGAVNVADLGAGACSGAGAAPTFHIPESNASDFAPSECSSHYRKGKHIVVNTNMYGASHKLCGLKICSGAGAGSILCAGLGAGSSAG